MQGEEVKCSVGLRPSLRPYVAHKRVATRQTTTQRYGGKYFLTEISDELGQPIDT